MTPQELLAQETLRIKKLILSGMQDELKQSDFDQPGSNPPLICALAELLEFFAIGNKDYQPTKEEIDWWLGFLDSMGDRVRKN